MKCFMTHQDCIYEKDIQQSLSEPKESLFMISPFGYPYDEIFTNIIEPAGEKARMDVWRADVAFQLGFVMCTKICKSMQQAKYVIADLTEDNANVFYELGLAWGFGKRIVIMRDMEKPFSNHFTEVLGTLDEGIFSYETPQEMQAQLPRKKSAEREGLPKSGTTEVRPTRGKQVEQRILSYEELLTLRTRLSRGEPPKLEEYLQDKAIDVQDRCGMERNRAQGAYIRDKQIRMCYRIGRTDAKFYMGAVKDALERVADNHTAKESESNAATHNKTRDSGAGRVDNTNGDIPRHSASFKPWALEPVPIGKEVLAQFLPTLFASSKVVIVDATHYDNTADASMYFAFGLSHAMGRETIPIANQARRQYDLPFDVRGLWQVYFQDLKHLTSGLVGILDVISPDYDIERHKYPLRYIWGNVLAHAGLRVITCSRGAENEEEDRPGGRTHVDKWDYTSVAELASFLGKEYQQAGIAIEPPREKAKVAASREVSDTARLSEDIEDDLQKTPDNIIIVGSPDVNDYAEVVLAKIYGVDPYRRAECKRSKDDALREKCWQCNRKNDPPCIGKRGYLFYKKTVEKEHARKTSHFFRDPPTGEHDCVVWYGSHLECASSLDTVGKTFGVLTLFKDRRGFFGNDDRWIVLLSGFTGVSTYILAKVLTTLEVKMKAREKGQEKAMVLQEALERKGLTLEQGVQVLVSVDYESEAGSQGYDPRNPTDFRIVSIKSLSMDKDRPADDSSRRATEVKPFPVLRRTARSSSGNEERRGIGEE